MESREDQADLLAVAPRQLAERPVQIGAESLGEGLGAAESLHSPQTGKQPQRLAPTRLLAVAEVPRQVSQAGADSNTLAPAVEVEEARAAAGRVQKVQQSANRRRLPRAVGSQEAEHFSCLHRETHVLYPARAPVALGELLGLDYRHTSETSARRVQATRPQNPGTPHALAAHQAPPPAASRRNSGRTPRCGRARPARRTLRRRSGWNHHLLDPRRQVRL